MSKKIANNFPQNSVSEKIKIEIDNREHALIEFAKNSEIIKNIIEIKTLDIADIIIKYDGNPVNIIERKEIKDLAASIKDGRYSSQKMRLIKFALENNLQKDKITYLIEGAFATKSATISGIKRTAINSCFVNLQARDGFRIHHSANVEDTLDYLQKYYQCLLKYSPAKSIEKAEDDYEKFIKSNVEISKKKNITPEICFINQLCNIPNISVKKAKNIAKKYKNWSELIGAYDGAKNEKEKEELLVNIDGIGKAISKKIYQYII